MLSSYIRSMLYAVEGLWHALSTERNLKLFALGVVLSLFLAALFRLYPADWVLLLTAGGVFLSVELLNTALERFTDAFDVHSKKQADAHTAAIKATKDIAASASLVIGLAWVSIICIVFWPYVYEAVGRLMGA
jgi:diacylglycerol kinase